MLNKEQNFYPKITIYTDGACSGNPGLGGWGSILIYEKQELNNVKKIIKELSGKQENTTNNQMELQAVIEALSVLKTNCNIDIYTDSKYVMDGATKWIFNWLKNNWKSSNKKNVKNKEQWLLLWNLLQNHNIRWHWVKGHADDEFNNKVDKLARMQCGTYD